MTSTVCVLQKEIPSKMQLLPGQIERLKQVLYDEKERLFPQTPPDLSKKSFIPCSSFLGNTQETDSPAANPPYVYLLDKTDLLESGFVSASIYVTLFNTESFFHKTHKSCHLIFLFSSLIVSPTIPRLHLPSFHSPDLHTYLSHLPFMLPLVNSLQVFL